MEFDRLRTVTQDPVYNTSHILSYFGEEKPIKTSADSHHQCTIDDDAKCNTGQSAILAVTGHLKFWKALNGLCAGSSLNYGPFWDHFYTNLKNYPFGSIRSRHHESSHCNSQLRHLLEELLRLGSWGSGLRL